MFSTISNALAVRKHLPISRWLGAATLLGFSASAGAQSITFSPIEPAPGVAVVCSFNGNITLSDNEDTCSGTVPAEELTFSGGAELTITGNGSSLQVLGGASSTLNGNTSMSGTQAFSGSTTFNSTVSFVGAAVTFDTGSTFNGTTNFTAGMSTVNINNSGAILTGTLNASGGLTASAGANVNMGNNIIHGVAAGVAPTDAVNVAQLIAATSGIATDISALETTTATHTTQIATLETTTATHTTQIATLQTDLTAETAARIAADTTLQTNMDAEAVTRAAADTALQSSLAATNTTAATHTTQINTLNTNVSALQTDVAGLQTDVGTLFDLRRHDRREARRGTAAAVAMSEAPMPSRDGGISYSLHGATYRGEYALGGSLKYRVNPAFAVDVGLSHAGHKDTAARVGFSGEF